MTSHRIMVISAGLGDPSTTGMLAGRIADATRHAVSALGDDAEVETVELRPLAHEITDAMLTGFAGSTLRPVLDRVADADALVFVSPTFQASYSGLFKSFVDVLDADLLTGKPVLVGATAGTKRHSLVLDHALRPLFSYLQALVVPTGVFAAPEDWGDGDDGSDDLGRRIERAAAELAGLLHGSGTGRRREDEFDMFSETMLAASRP